MVKEHTLVGVQHSRWTVEIYHRQHWNKPWPRV